MFNLGWPEWLLILGIILIIFGVGRLPEVGGALGNAIREFRTATKGLTEEEASESQEKDENSQE